MTFAEKLDLLMKITNTSNSLLARSIALDASFISRLRRGDRTPAKNVTYLQGMAGYFARNCRADYQKAALWEAICSSSSISPVDAEAQNDLETVIAQWLKENETPAADSINEFLDGIINFQFKKAEPAAAVDIKQMPADAVSEVEVFYGVKGKRTAVLTFLSRVVKSKSPQTLLLYSDEDLGWLAGDREFTAQWALLLMQFLKSGGRIRIIHAINRNFDEMLTGIKQWVPLYMTGAIEPFYYPKTRDGLFHKTMFIAPDIPAAVTSSSIGGGAGTENAANFLFNNQETIRTLVQEYHAFLHFCRPLMHISTSASKKEYPALLAEFENEKANAVFRADGLAGITLPLSVVNSMVTRLEEPQRELFLAYYQKRAERLFQDLKNNSFTVICTLPDPAQILAGKAAVDFSVIFDGALLHYTPEEYLRHLRSVIRLLETYKHFSVCLSSDQHLKGVTVYVKEDVGVLVIKPTLPAVVFAINESNMTAAFWDYFHNLLNKRANGSQNRSHTLEKLKEFADRLEKMFT